MLSFSRLLCLVIVCASVASVTAEHVTCQACVQGEFCFLGLNQTCPEHSTSPSTSDNIEDCVCFGGYYQDPSVPTTHACVPCPIDSYCVDDQIHSCVEHTTSAALSSLAAECRCKTGYTGADGGPCTACVAGTFKSVVGSAGCSSCGENTYSTTTAAVSATTCQACPTNSLAPEASDDVSDCVCVAGYERSNDICVACAPGYANPSAGGTCVACGNGEYSSSSAQTTCATCPGTSGHELTAVNSIAGCLCDPGYTGTNGVCTICQAGTFKASSGSEPCETCASGTISGDGASVCSSCPDNSVGGGSSIDDCLCEPGFQRSGDLCVACVEGKYKNETSNAVCLDCEAGTFSDAAQTVQCDACPIDTYQSLTGQTVCQNCIANSASGNGSAVETDCKCVQGYTRVDGSCALCLVGYYKDTISNGACSACPSGYTSATTGSVALSDCQPCTGNTYSHTTETGTVCVGCPVNSNVGWAPYPLNGIDSCKCDPGFTGLASTGCVACELGKYKSTSGSSLCVNCPDGSIGNAAWTHLRFNTSACATCPANTYTQDLLTCASCPQHSVSDAGSNEIQDCVCDVGYFQDSGSCQPCAAGYVKLLTGNQACDICGADTYANNNACQDCPDNTQSTSGSSSVTACFCNAGYTGTITTTTDTCTACVLGTYKTSPGTAACSECNENTYYNGDAPYTTSSCTSCPDFSTSPKASGSISDCECDSGYTRQDNTCSLCPVNYYCPNENTVTACTTGSASPEGSTAATACVCVPGFYGAPDTCTLCPVNSYCSGGTHIQSCPDHSTTLTLAGQTNASACVCDAGHYFTDGACSECPADTYCANQVKVQCPLNSSAVAGQDSIAQCFCDEYFTKDANNECVLCNTHVVCHGVQTTIIDGVEVMSAGTVDICGANSTNVHQSCRCEPGWYCGDGTSSDSCIAPSTCQPCPEGSVCNNNQKFVCPSNQTSPDGSHHADHCVCLEGYYLVGGNDCFRCPVGAYCTNETLSLCSTFDTNLTTEGDGHDQLTDCLCRAGYFRDSYEDTCKLCPKDFYCPSETTTTKPNVIDCGANQRTDAAGASSHDACTCDAGFYLSNENSIMECLPCKEGERCVGGEVLEFFCHLQDRTANADHSACVCQEGFEEDYNAHCVACSPGYIKTAIGNDACVLCDDGFFWLNETQCLPCRANSHSSADRTTCYCDAPRQLISGVCQLCAENEYYHDGSCSPCPQHSTTEGASGTTGIYSCQCDPGYVFEPSTGLCNICPANTYQNAGVCVSCGSGALSPAGSTASSACQCNATLCQDFTWGNDCSGQCEVTPENCDPCATGHFKNFISAIGNTDICQQCGGDTYQDETGQTACKDCHATRTNKNLAQTSVDACECRAGYEELVADASAACSPCAAGSFKGDHGDFSCSLCDIGTFSQTTTSTVCLQCSDESPTTGANTTVDAGSDHVDLCVCFAGSFRNTDDNTCELCARGRYKTTKGMQACDFCGVSATLNHYGQDEIGATTQNHCVLCPDNSGQVEALVGSTYVMDDVTKCLCFPGHDSFTSIDGCDTCAEDEQLYAAYTFKLGTNNNECQFCQDGDYFTASNQACVTCELLDENNERHTALAVNSLDTALRWGVDEGDCVCNLGYHRVGDACFGCSTGSFRNVTETLVCTDCGYNEYQDQTASLNCTFCPPNSHTNGTGKSMEQDCLCDAGYELDSQQHICNACPAGKFSPHGSNVCEECPENMFSLSTAASCTSCGANERSLPNSPSQAHCNCLPGFGGQPCSPCANASYSPGGVPETDQYPTCISCPDFKTSPTHSDAIADCHCLPGYGGDNGLVHTQPCALCVNGKYSTGYSLSPCRLCGFGAISDPEQGATSFDACQCNAELGLKEES